MSDPNPQTPSPQTRSYAEVMAELGQAVGYDPAKQRHEDDPTNLDLEFKERKDR